jgi:hypothetical protein
MSCVLPAMNTRARAQGLREARIGRARRCWASTARGRDELTRDALGRPKECSRALHLPKVRPLPTYRATPTAVIVPEMRPLTALLCLALTACGGNDDESGDNSDGTCMLRAGVTGATSIQFTGKNDAVCLTQHSFEAGLQATFSGFHGQGTLELIIDDVQEGQLGDDLVTQVEVTSASRERWQSMLCRASITAHDLVEVEASEIGELRHYQVAGAVTCPEPLPSLPTGDEPVTLETLSFRAQFTWRD